MVGVSCCGRCVELEISWRLLVVYVDYVVSVVVGDCEVGVGGFYVVVVDVDIM